MRKIPQIVFLKPYADVFQGSVIYYDAGEVVTIGGAGSINMEEAAKLMNAEIAIPAGDALPKSALEPVIPLTAISESN